MTFITLIIAFISLWMAWPGLRRPVGTSPGWYAARWVLFGLLVGSTLLLLHFYYGLMLWAKTH